MAPARSGASCFVFRVDIDIALVLLLDGNLVRRRAISDEEAGRELNAKPEPNRRILAFKCQATYGVQLWPILQDVHQLRATYGQRAGTFLSNAGVLQVFGVNDHESARLVSDLLGQQTAVFQTMGQALDSEKSGISYGEHHAGRPLLTPDEVRNLPQNIELLFLAGQRPILAGKLGYYADPEFKGLFDQA